MTIRQYHNEIREDFVANKGQSIEQADEFFEFMKGVVEVWHNSACLGYVVATLQTMKKSPNEIEEIVKNLSAQFESLSVDEAELLYYHSIH